MRFASSSSCLFSLFLILAPHTCAQYLNDVTSAVARELEHLLLDGSPLNIQSLVTPCTTYVDSSTGKVNKNAGRNTAAEWVRTAFHDSITGSIYTYQGGVDASIGFETGRDENIGTAFNDAIINFSYFYNARVSMADLIAMGVVVAVGHCGGPLIPLRPGRIDATAAGVTGVPKPEQDLRTQLEIFQTAGFNQDDTIALTACGHTLGGVRKVSFPTIFTPGTPGPLEGTDQRAAFDTSVGTFDNNVVKEYISGTGQKGGVLVTTTNNVMKSDFRLYNSDGNNTMQRLSASTGYFQGQCQALFQRMIEFVPGPVQLADDVGPSTTTNLKPYNLNLNIDWKGNMALGGYLRYVQVAGAPVGPGQYTVTLIKRGGGLTTTTAQGSKSASDTGTGLYGPTNNYKFTLNFPATTGLSGIKAGDRTFNLQDTMFVVPAMSSMNPSLPNFVLDPAVMDVQAAYSTNVTVAYNSNAAPATLQGKIVIPVPQTGSKSPKIDGSSTFTLNKIGKIGTYTIYSGLASKTMTAKQVYGMSLDIGVAGQPAGVAFYKLFNPFS